MAACALTFWIFDISLQVSGLDVMTIWAVLGGHGEESWGLLRLSWGDLGTSWGCLGAFWDAIGGILGPLVVILDRLGVTLRCEHAHSNVNMDLYSF